MPTYFCVFTKYQILWTNFCLHGLLMQQLQPVCRHQERQVNSNSFFMLVLFSTCVCTTCLNDLDSPGISILLCQCCPCHYMVCSRTPLVLSPHAHPKAWWSRCTQAWSRSQACLRPHVYLCISPFAHTHVGTVIMPTRACRRRRNYTRASLCTHDHTNTCMYS